MKNPTENNFVSEVEWACRCGQAVAFGKADGVPCGMHASPHCKEFQEMELILYMQWIRGDA